MLYINDIITLTPSAYLVHYNDKPEATSRDSFLKDKLTDSLLVLPGSSYYM